jgi:hypothetical protein
MPITAAILGVVLVGASLGMWFGMPEDTRDAFSWPQTLTIAAVLLIIVGALYLLGHSRLRADEKGLTVVNLTRTRHLAWTQVVGVTFRQGYAWARLDVDDGTTIPVMGIQSADGPRGRAAARELAELIAARTRTVRND